MSKLMKKHQPTASPLIRILYRILTPLIALTIILLGTVSQAQAAGFAFFSPQSVQDISVRVRNDSEARNFFTAVLNYSSRSLARPPMAQATLRIEGNLSSQDAVIVNDDMQALIAFGLDYRLQGTSRALDQANLYLLAWAKTYRPTGNPIDEEAFFKYVAGYELVRESMAQDARLQVDGFLRRLFDAERAFTAARDPSVSHSNWESRHLALATAIAFSLGDTAMIGYSERRYREQISFNILSGGAIRVLVPEAAQYPKMASRLDEYVPRGATFDLLQRDSMEYHVASVQGLLIAAWVAANQGLDWVGMAGTNGQTLRDALDFTIPYATGSKTHLEFARTLVSFDIEKNRGGIFNPRYAQVLLGLAAMLDSRYSGFANSSVLPPLERVLSYSKVQPR